VKLGSHPDLIAAMRAADVPAPQERGLWYIQRQSFDYLKRHPALRAWHLREYGFAAYPDHPLVTTSLCRWTDATLDKGHGECVMSDDPRELRRHLPVVLAARGRVLVTGLGLGCVLRGLLRRPAVTHIDVIELDAGVLEMVAPSFAGESRLTIHQGDALTHRWPAGVRWDFIWHDVWNDKPDTQIIHAQLLKRYRGLGMHHGAWGFPRWMKRRWPTPLLGAPRKAVLV
jgi:hypothetical protein